MHLDLAQLRAANVSRKARWYGEDDHWTLADWSNAMCGEAGEAANVVKKIRRTDTPGLWEAQKYPGDGHASGLVDASADEARLALSKKLADECADVLCYLDLLAEKAGIDLAAAVIAKFNRVSAAQGFPERIGVDRTEGSAEAEAERDKVWDIHQRAALDQYVARAEKAEAPDDYKARVEELEADVVRVRDWNIELEKALREAIDELSSAASCMWADGSHQNSHFASDAAHKSRCVLAQHALSTPQAREP